MLVSQMDGFGYCNMKWDNDFRSFFKYLYILSFVLITPLASDSHVIIKRVCIMCIYNTNTTMMDQFQFICTLPPIYYLTSYLLNITRSQKVTNNIIKNISSTILSGKGIKWHYWKLTKRHTDYSKDNDVSFYKGASRRLVVSPASPYPTRAPFQ